MKLFLVRRRVQVDTGTQAGAASLCTAVRFSARAGSGLQVLTYGKELKHSWRNPCAGKK